MPRLYDDPENVEAGELVSPRIEEATSATYSHQMSSPNPLQSPAGSQMLSVDRFASLVHSPVSPAHKSARSSARSSLAGQVNGAGEKINSPAHSKDGKDGKDGGELSPASTRPRQSSRLQSASVQVKPVQKASSTVKQELRPKGKVSAKGAVQKVGRPAKTVTTQRKGRPARNAKETKITASAQEKRKEWEVEKIVDSRIEEETLQHFFRVKWKGFSDKHNTWEPKRNLANCKSLVEAYEKKAGK